MYALIKDNLVLAYAYGYNNLREDYPATSFPASMTDEELARWDVVPVAQVDRPYNNDHTKTVTEGWPTKVGDTWTQTWIVEDASAELVAERTAERAQSVRSERNAMIASCDWTQLPDAPVDQKVWAEYRQALRDIPEQFGFPWDVSWPIQP